MASVFHRLIRKEFGEKKYNQYFFCYQKLLTTKRYNSKNLENKEIYDDIYNKLKDKDLSALKKMSERLLDAMYQALRISRSYYFILIFYLCAGGFIALQGLIPWITIIALLAMSSCFLYKTYEFVINKYCFIDAHIVLVYKSVLDKLILSYDNTIDKDN